MQRLSGCRFRFRAGLAGLALAVVLGAGTQRDPQAQAPVQILSQADVLAVLAAGASALADPNLAVSVVDRAGTILGVYQRNRAATLSLPLPPQVDLSIALARTGAFFSNDQAPLSSRTVRFISGIHFPPGIANTPNAALYGIENTNRGCALDPAGDAVFNPGQLVPRSRSFAGTFAVAPGQLPQPCSAAGRAGCGPGIATGKPNLRDAGAPLAAAVNPGGLPLYRQGRVIGGVGVAGVPAERAEFAAAVAAAGTRPATGITTGLTFPSPPLPAPGAVFIDGIRLPFFRACLDFPCVQDAVDNRPAGSSAGSFSPADLLMPTLAVPAEPARAAPEGYLIEPRASDQPNGMTVAEVQGLISRAVDRANLTRAQIRLPLGSTTRMIIGVTDRTGRILAAFRMPDATVFSLDVAIAKARNAHHFSTRAGYDELRQRLLAGREGYSWEPLPPAGRGWAMTNRTLSYGGQPLFPPGIEEPDDPGSGRPGPWFELFVSDTQTPCREGDAPSAAIAPGIVWFPGSAPLYRRGELIGGVGVSGDGVEQDDYVTAAAARGFEPPADLRVDQSFISTGRGQSVRLPYFKFPRNPEER